MIEVRCFHNLEEISAFRADINRINLDSAQPDPFSTFEFIENYILHDEDHPEECSSESQGMRLWFLIGFVADKPVAYLPLKQCNRKVFGVSTLAIEFLIIHDNDRPHVVAEPAYLHTSIVAFYEYLLSHKHEWSFLGLQQQDNTSALFPPPADINLRGYWVRDWPTLENCTVHIRWDTLREYFFALARKHRANFSRHIRNLFAAGDVQLISSADPSVTPALLELYRSIESHSWKSQAQINIGRHSERIEYFFGLLGTNQPMQISIQVLLLNGMPVAGLITGAFRQGLYGLQIVYDDRLKHLSPGSAMLLLGMRQAIAGRYTFFNLLSGYGYFKSRWLAKVTNTRMAQIYRISGLPFWSRLLGDFRRWLLTRKSKPEDGAFNPLRRSVGDSDPEKISKESKNVVYPIKNIEEIKVANLIAEVRQGDCEFLTSSELRAILPFNVSREPDNGVQPQNNKNSSG